MNNGFLDSALLSGFWTRSKFSLSVSWPFEQRIGALATSTITLVILLFIMWLFLSLLFWFSPSWLWLPAKSGSEMIERILDYLLFLLQITFLHTIVTFGTSHRVKQHYCKGDKFHLAPSCCAVVLFGTIWTIIVITALIPLATLLVIGAVIAATSYFHICLQHFLCVVLEMVCTTIINTAQQRLNLYWNLYIPNKYFGLGRESTTNSSTSHHRRHFSCYPDCCFANGVVFFWWTHNLQITVRSY